MSTDLSCTLIPFRAMMRALASELEHLSHALIPFCVTTRASASEPEHTTSQRSLHLWLRPRVSVMPTEVKVRIYLSIWALPSLLIHHLVNLVFRLSDLAVAHKTVKNAAERMRVRNKGIWTEGGATMHLHEGSQKTRPATNDKRKFDKENLQATQATLSHKHRKQMSTVSGLVPGWRDSIPTLHSTRKKNTGMTAS